MAQRIAEEEEKRMFEEMNETERLKKEQRHVDDKRKQQEVKQATIRSLDAQVSWWAGSLHIHTTWSMSTGVAA